MVKNILFPFILLSILFLASCKSPIAPHTTGRISFFTPKDTTLNDSLRVVFRFKIDNVDSKEILEWNFGDGVIENTTVTKDSNIHIFPGMGDYQVKITLLDTITKKILDSSYAAIHIFVSPPTLAELQQMKYFKIEVYCPIRNNFNSSNDTTISLYLFTIDPESGPLPNRRLKTPLNWSHNLCSLIQHSSSFDTLRGFNNTYDGTVSEEESWQFQCSLNADYSAIDSTKFSYYYTYDYNYLPRPSTGSEHLNESMVTKLSSLSFLNRTNGTFTYQAFGVSISDKIKNIFRKDYKQFSAGTIDSVLYGPYWNFPYYRSSYTRVTFYK
jgi:hypothetical protein